MNNPFIQPYSHFQEPYPLFPTVAEPQQGDLGYSDPRRYRSATVNSHRSLPSSCPTPILAHSPGFSPYSHLPPVDLPYSHPPALGLSTYRTFQPRFQPAAPEHTPNFVRKDSYWSNLPPTTISGIRKKVAKTFVDLRQEHQRAKRVALRERPFTMSSSTALLPKNPDAKRGDSHPIFLRVCHSPWTFIGQRALVFLRGVTAAYLLVSFLMCIQYDLQNNEHGWLVAFELSNVVYLLQIIYSWLAFTWTFMHLYYPHHANQIQTNSTRFQKVFSPPRQNPTTKNRTFFSIFFNAAVTFPLVVAFIHWAILIPQHETAIPADKIFTTGWYTQFFILNKFAITVVIALIEVFVYCSIRRADPVAAHIFGLTVLCLCYVGWTFVGYVVCDKYAYYFFDHKKVGWEDFAIAIVMFIVITNTMFLFIYGLTGIREKLTKRGEDRKSGGSYIRLPQ